MRSSLVLSQFGTVLEVPAANLVGHQGQFGRRCSRFLKGSTAKSAGTAAMAAGAVSYFEPCKIITNKNNIMEMANIL